MYMSLKPTNNRKMLKFNLFSTFVIIQQSWGLERDYIYSNRMAIFFENFYEKMKPPDMQLILIQHMKKV